MIDEIRAKRYCKDDISKIENYKKAVNDNTQSYDMHHRNELTLDGKFAHTKEDLIRMNMYYNRPCNELIFLTKSEHAALHRKVFHHSEETKQKMSEARKGEKNTFYGKTHTDDTRKKMSEAKKGKHHTDETRIKMSEAHKGRTFSDETRKKMSESRKGKTWKIINGKRVWLSKEGK